MDQDSKRRLTSLMWAIQVPIVVIALIFSPAYAPFISPLWLVVFPIAIVAFVTLALWVPAVLPWVDAERLRAMGMSESETYGEAGKRKRRAASADDRLDALLSLMTPEEREDFVYELKRRVLENASIGEDGEINYSGRSIESLFEDEPSRLRDER